jgi:hypothetical protein
VAETTSYPDTDNFAVARLTAYGAPDNDFDDDGKLITGIGGEESAQAVAIQADGKIVAGGRGTTTASRSSATTGATARSTRTSTTTARW